MTNVFYAYHTQSIGRWLNLLGIKVPTCTIDNTLQEHPEWPSLLCVSDALNRWQIPNMAARAENNNLPNIQVPFLAVTNHPERPFAIVTNFDKGQVKHYQNNYKKASIENVESFAKRWTGVYMVAEKSTQSGVANYNALRIKALKGRLLPMLAILAFFTILTTFFTQRITQASTTIIGLGLLLQYILYVAGLGTSALLLWYEVDQQNMALQKVCTSFGKTNYNAVLSSNASKLLPWISWSEAGFVYFIGGLLLLALPQTAAWAPQCLGWLGFAALGYPPFSIYYQWKVVKQWCPLCLAVQAILIMQAINYKALLYNSEFGFIGWNFTLIIICAYGIPALLWFTIKPNLEQQFKAKQENRAYLRLKFNPEVFETLLYKQKAMVTSTEGLGIHLGNSQAPNTIVKVCNPYCGPCSEAHPKLEKLRQTHKENLRVQIIFVVPDAPTGRIIQTVSHFLAIADKEPNKIEKALEEWYLPKKKNLEEFAAYYPINGEINHQEMNISAMIAWCIDNEIRYTPTIFYNGHELPKDYALEDLGYFLQK